MSNNPQSNSPKLPKAPKRKSEQGGSPTPKNWKGLTLFMLAASLLLVAFWAHKTATEGATRIMSPTLLDEQLKGNNVSEIAIYSEPTKGITYLKGDFKDPLPANPEKRLPEAAKFKTEVNLDFDKGLNERLASYGFPNIQQKYIDNQWLQFLGTMLPFLLFILLMYFFFRHQIKSAGKGAFSFGKSKAKILNKDKNKITFKDVAGIDEEKEELSEIVDFLKDPRKFQRLGGQIPKGVLMVGPPGTGKTLLAKAIAGEADVPFYSISGSDFVEMFVGVGASRVRDMFEQGRKNAPCLIFIDEIDAVGRSRGHGVGGGHDEREQTLNALLVEMDGIDTQEGVIIIAATNRKDVLDPALLRPGRFDREVNVSLPDVKGREQILLVHSKKVKAAETVQWNLVARGTPGFSGAELANLLNEAALLAARRDAEAIEQSDLEEARDKVRWGRERRSLAMTEEEKKNTAYHEAGHALLNVVLEHTDPLHKVTIIPRGPSLGVMMSLPEKDQVSYYKKRLIDQMCVTMGGRVAEEIFLGDVCSGASMDIHQATSIARSMVTQWGMSEKLGMVRYGGESDPVFLGRDISRSRSYSEATAQEIDDEVLKLVGDAHQKARDIITEKRDSLQAIAEALLEYETLDGKQVEELIKTGKMSNPPSKHIDPPSTPLPDEAVGDGLADKKEDKRDNDGTLPDLEGAPAGA